MNEKRLGNLKSPISEELAAPEWDEDFFMATLQQECYEEFTYYLRIGKRRTRFEHAASTLARLRSTPELHPHVFEL